MHRVRKCKGMGRWYVVRVTRLCRTFSDANAALSAANAVFIAACIHASGSGAERGEGRGVLKRGHARARDSRHAPGRRPASSEASANIVGGENQPPHLLRKHGLNLRRGCRQASRHLGQALQGGGCNVGGGSVRGRRRGLKFGPCSAPTANAQVRAPPQRGVCLHVQPRASIKEAELLARTRGRRTYWRCQPSLHSTPTSPAAPSIRTGSSDIRLWQTQSAWGGAGRGGVGRRARAGHASHGSCT